MAMRKQKCFSRWVRLHLSSQNVHPFPPGNRRFFIRQDCRQIEWIFYSIIIAEIWHLHVAPTSMARPKHVWVRVLLFDWYAQFPLKKCFAQFFFSLIFSIFPVNYIKFNMFSYTLSFVFLFLFFLFPFDIFYCTTFPFL